MSNYELSKEQIKELLKTRGRITVPESEWDYDYPTIAGRIEETKSDILREALIEFLYD